MRMFACIFAYKYYNSHANSTYCMQKHVQTLVFLPFLFREPMNSAFLSVRLFLENGINLINFFFIPENNNFVVNGQKIFEFWVMTSKYLRGEVIVFRPSVLVKHDP